jgi:DNA-binding transcriptional ArsR family regulator
MSAAREQSLADVANLSGILSDKTRLHIVLLLAKGDRDVTSLIEELTLKQPSVSHHLGLLRMNELIVGKRKGKQVIYSLAENIKASGGKIEIMLPSATVTVEAGGRQISPRHQKASGPSSGGSLFDLRNA